MDRRFVALAALPVLAACTPPAPDGGYVLANWTVDAQGARGDAMAQFYSDVVGDLPPVDPWRDTPLGTCGPLPSSHPAKLELTGRDVGSSISLKATTRVLLARTFVANLPVYEAGALTAQQLPPGSSFDVEIAESGSAQSVVWSQALALPRAPVLVAPAASAGTIAFSGAAPLDVTFEPFSAEDDFLLFTGANGGAVCHLPDTGSFAVPAETIATLPSNGTIRLFGMTENRASLDARDVDLVGTSALELGYRRE